MPSLLHGSLGRDDGMFAKLEAAADAAHLRAFGLIKVDGVSRPRVAAGLNRCIEAATDSEKTYALAATNVRDGRLRVMLHDQSKRRGALVTELQNVLESVGCEAENDGSTAGALRRGLLGLEIALGARSGRTLLAQCEAADVRTLKVYETVRRELARLALPELDAVIDAQRAVIDVGRTGLRKLLVGVDARR